MQQFINVKQEYPDYFVFYRLGDFYEMFFEDAVKGAKILEITLTSRNKQDDEPIPMCGIPVATVQNYIDVLIGKGHKIAICEQVEDSKGKKGMLNRRVVQLITPGTVTTGSSLKNKKNNYIAAIGYSDDLFGLAYADLTTGEIRTTELHEEDIVDEITTIDASELLLLDSISKKKSQWFRHHLKNTFFTKSTGYYATSIFDELINTIASPLVKSVLSGLLGYIEVTQKSCLTHLQVPIEYDKNNYLIIDSSSKKHLELIESLTDGKSNATLLWLLDETKTAMGSRRLRRWIERPLIDEKKIVERRTIVKDLRDHFFERSELVDNLNNVYDLERLCGKVSFESANARDLNQLKISLEKIPTIKKIIEKLGSQKETTWQRVIGELDSGEDLVMLIQQSIKDNPSNEITVGNIIKQGFNKELDNYRYMIMNGKKILMELEQREREKTGIKNLKIGFNKIFGYYIEITKKNLGNLHQTDYQRKQTLANAERFTTEELLDLEFKILNAEKESTELEYRLYVEIRNKLKKNILRIQKTSKAISKLDALQSLAFISEKYHYISPTISNDSNLTITEGRHPVIEKVLNHQNYVPNSLHLDENEFILLITGPNMSGKSTFMRQLALIVILNQIGCFVPAKEANIPIFDRIFTRIGASDDLASGKSTFMVEMSETKDALTKSTVNSLILLDEIGRGTSTYDGMALAQAIIEYISSKVKAKTLFSTHYHELTFLEKELDGLKNNHVKVIEKNKEIIFLHKLISGSTDKSYGIQVAKLAGVPDEVIDRAHSILKNLETISFNKECNFCPNIKKNDSVFQVAKKEHMIFQLIDEIDINSLTPIESLNILFKLVKLNESNS